MTLSMTTKLMISQFTAWQSLIFEVYLKTMVAFWDFQNHLQIEIVLDTHQVEVCLLNIHPGFLHDSDSLAWEQHRQGQLGHSWAIPEFSPHRHTDQD